MIEAIYVIYVNCGKQQKRHRITVSNIEAMSLFLIYNWQQKILFSTKKYVHIFQPLGKNWFYLVANQVDAQLR